MRDVFFGLGLELDNGTDPAVAINRNGIVLQINKSEYVGLEIHARIGTINGSSVRWRKSNLVSGGIRPSCALNAANVAVEVHNNEGHLRLYRSVGRVEDGVLSVYE